MTLHLAARLAAALPASWVPWLGRLLGWLAFHVVRPRRGVAIDNIQNALGTTRTEARRLAAASYIHLCTGALEFLRLGSLTHDGARAIMGHGLDALLGQAAAGRGVLVLTGHLGHWDLLAAAASFSGLRVNVVTRSIKSRWLDAFWRAQREGCGVRLLRAHGAALSVLRALGRNEIVALALDQHEPGGVRLPFFGRPAATDTALARIAIRTGSPVVPVFLRRTPEGYRCVVLAPVPLRRTADPAADIVENTKMFLEVVEAQIREVPEQWLWLHRRWKGG